MTNGEWESRKLLTWRYDIILVKHKSLITISHMWKCEEWEKKKKNNTYSWNDFYGELVNQIF